MSDLDAKNFWHNLNTLIKNQNTTQRSLSVACGLAERRIESLSTYNRLPNVFECYKIANALGVSVEYLVTGNEPDNSSAVNDVKRKLTELTDSINKL